METKLSSINRFGSKAETLKQIAQLNLRCNVPLFMFFTHKEWMDNREAVYRRIFSLFGAQRVAIRSSALCEDGTSLSHAGAFLSYLDVSADNHHNLSEKVDSVFSSYIDENSGNQVMIQKMVDCVSVSGVIMTRSVDDGTPYYVLNYDDESGRSDSVTGGLGVHKTVMVYRRYDKQFCDSPRIQRMMSLARELEEYFGAIPLDIEFALDISGCMHLLQVRRITTVRGWHPDSEHRVTRIIPHVEEFVRHYSSRKNGLYGDYAILGNMSDWNPAEMIGAIPLPLAASLYRMLITANVWCDARAIMGYRKLPHTELMALIAGRPYIDVRASFNSFLPSGLSGSIGEKIVGAWLNRLFENPSLHDKIEFDIAQTSLDFTFDETFKERYGQVLGTSDLAVYKNSLRLLTCSALAPSGNGTLPEALRQIDFLADAQNHDGLEIQTDSPVILASHIGALLANCTRDGTLPFSIIARHAFISESFLRSAIVRGALAAERVSQFKSSFCTVMGTLARDTMAVVNGDLSEDVFSQRYGHLRPGTYDILSPCYRHRLDLFVNCSFVENVSEENVFVLSSKEKVALNKLLSEHDMHVVDADGLLSYARLAIQGREYAKFVFTKNLSAALEAISNWGDFYNLGREDLAYLAIEDILNTSYASKPSEMTSFIMQIVDRSRVNHSLSKLVKLSFLIRGVRDLHVVPMHRSQPNFITQKKVEGLGVWIESVTIDHGILNGKIVCIENADPGFDWIFTKGIAGLVTKYGGANSHMAIRCSELQLPAAIGCGDQLFEKAKSWRIIVMDCSSKSLRSSDDYGYL